MKKVSKNIFASAAILLFSFAISTLLYAQIVTLRLSDGSSVTGELKGYEDGAYLLEVFGSIKKVEDTNVIDVTITEDIKPPVIEAENLSIKMPGIDLGDIKKSLDRIEDAIGYVNSLLTDYQKKKDEVYKRIEENKDEFKRIFCATHKEYIDCPIVAEALPKISVEFDKVLELPREYSGELIDYLFARLDGVVATQPESKFLAAIIKLVSTSIAQNKISQKEDKDRFISLLVKLGERLHQIENYSSAIEVIGLAITNSGGRDAKGSAPIVQKMVEVQYSQIQNLISKSKLDEANTHIAGLIKDNPNSIAVIGVASKLKKEVILAKYNQIRQLIESEKVDEASTAVADLLKAEPNNETVVELHSKLKGQIILAKYNAIRQLVETKKLDEAATAVADLLKAEPNDKTVIELSDKLKDMIFEARCDSIINLFARAKVKEAKEILSDLMRTHPNNAKLIDISNNIEFEVARMKYSALLFADERITFLTDYITKTQKPEQKKWAENELELVKKQPHVGVSKLPSDANSYFPVQPGLWHKYKRSSSDIIEKIKVDSVSKEEGLLKIYFTQDRTYKNYTTSQTFQLEADGSNIYKPAIDGKEVILRFPVREGENWSWKDKRSEYVRTYKSVSETVTTPAGKFDKCLLLEFTSTLYSINSEAKPLVITSRSYYAPGVGLVKLEMLEGDYSKYSMELIEYGVEQVEGK